jgi:hypothetical protein
LDNFYETEKYIYLTFGFNGNVFSGLYDKNTKTLKHSKHLSTNYKQIAGEFVNSNTTSIFGFVETNDLERLNTKIKEKYNLFDIKEFDNPIITISHLK